MLTAVTAGSGQASRTSLTLAEVACYHVDSVWF